MWLRKPIQFRISGYTHIANCFSIIHNLLLLPLTVTVLYFSPFCFLVGFEFASSFNFRFIYWTYMCFIHLYRLSGDSCWVRELVWVRCVMIDQPVNPFNSIYALLLLIYFTCWWSCPFLHVSMKFFSIFIFLVAYGHQIRSLEALQKLFEQFPGAFMDTLHVALPNRCCLWYVTFSCFNCDFLFCSWKVASYLRIRLRKHFIVRKSNLTSWNVNVTAHSIFIYRGYEHIAVTNCSSIQLYIAIKTGREQKAH